MRSFLAFSLVCMQEKASDDIPMPTYFRFLALLAFKIFELEQVSGFTFCTAPPPHPHQTNKKLVISKGLVDKKWGNDCKHY